MTGTSSTLQTHCHHFSGTVAQSKWRTKIKDNQPQHVHEFRPRRHQRHLKNYKWTKNTIPRPHILTKQYQLHRLSFWATGCIHDGVRGMYNHHTNYTDSLTTGAWCIEVGSSSQFNNQKNNFRKCPFETAHSMPHTTPCLNHNWPT